MSTPVQDTPQEIVVLSATEKATKELIKNITGIQKVVELLPGFQEQVEELNEQVAIKSNLLKTLEVDVEKQARVNKIELDLKVRENEDGILNTILRARELVTIMPGDKRDLEEAAKANELTVKTAVSKAEAILKTALENKHDSEITKLDLEYKATTAESTAKINNLEEKVKFLEEQLKASEDRAAAKLQAEIKIAEAGTGITVNTSANK